MNSPTLADTLIKRSSLVRISSYNVNYLESEYNFAVQSAQMAVKWADYVADGDRYYLQYRTAGDGKVRAEHAALHGTTLPVDDPFWDKYFPPLGWNCRCTAVQVRKDKYPASDSATAMQAGDNATSGAKQQIFRFNPGKEGKIFPPKHPYLPKGCKGCNKNKLNLAYNPNSEDCRACLGVAQCEHTICNKREYERLKKDPDYIDVEFDPNNGGVKGTHKDHNFDKKRGWYEKIAQDAGYKEGHSVIFKKEDHTIFNVRSCEGLWDNQLFEVAGAENATSSNIRNALKHCAYKKATQVAVIVFPDKDFDLKLFNEGYSRFCGLKGTSQYKKFNVIYCIDKEGNIIYTKKPSD